MPDRKLPDQIENHCSLRIVREIASGGMGTVWEAVQQGAGGFEKRVAIKEILPEFCQEASFVDMFVAEAKLVANLVHENIVQIYQLGASQSRHYIVMEYVHGMSLAEFIARHRPSGENHSDRSIPVELVVFIASRIARGLAYAHRRQDRLGKPLRIVHRDICPNNVLITTEGLPKLGDFGIASVANVHGDPDGGPCVGKLAYMAPEQAQSAELDFRADIYSLGMVMFEMLALTRMREPWKENMLVAAINGWVDWSPLPRGLPRKLLTIMQTMMAVAPEDRYQSTDALAHDLELFIYHKGYGPTVVTLEKYLLSLAPTLYVFPDDDTTLARS